MSQTRFTLKSWPYIILAYFLGPFAGLNTWWLLRTGHNAFVSELDLKNTAMSWNLVIVFGGVICLAVELVIITPLLVGFQRHRWRWLNTWSSAAIGFLLGAVPWTALEIIAGWDERMRIGKAGEHTQAAQKAFEQSIIEPLMFGLIGLIAALVFRLIAVRTVRTEDASTFD
jgi:hypothetical protein